jgi:folate-binding protein YgfZ
MTIDSLLSQLPKFSRAHGSHLGIIRLIGPDSAKFLQGQYTSDTNLLSPTASLYGAVCNPKGRIISSFFALKAPQSDDLLLVMERDLVETTLAHLQKYAVFFKTQLSDVSDEFALYLEYEQLVAAHEETVANTLATVAEDGGVVITTTADKVQRHLRLVSGEQSLEEEQADAARVFELLIARPLTNLADNSNLLPQWLNMQANGGINFRKGCYTGQEIIARMKYKGQSKKQMGLFASSTPLNEGSDITNEQGKNIGNVWRSASFGDLHLALGIYNVSEDTQYQCADAVLTGLPLPYEVA